MFRNSNRITLAVISSPGHSGQTWLCLLIGSNSQTLSLGEINHIYGQKDVSRACSFCPGECEFWGEFNQVWQPKHNLFQQLAEFSGKQVFSISGLGRYQEHITGSNLLVKVIRLIRDGRATTASFLRKYPEHDYEDIVRNWVSVSQELDQWTAKFSPENQMRLRYEDILTNTSGQLKRVCDFLEIGFEKEMIEYWKQKHHLVAGNRGTVSFIRRAHGMDFDAVDKPFYAQQDPYSFQDHRWSNELTAYHLYLFEKIGGDLNRDYGYLSSQQPVGFPEAVHYGLRRRMRFLKRILMPPVSFNYRTTTRIVHNILRVRSE